MDLSTPHFTVNETTTISTKLTNLRLSLGRLRYHQRGIFGRCTNVYDGTVRTGNTNVDGVCKIAWPLLSRPNEHALLEKVHAIDPAHTPDFHCAWDVSIELPSRRLRPQCTNTSSIEYHSMRVTVMTKYHPIDNLERNDFLSAFTQIMQCNVRLCEAECVHHRDLSPGNMVYHQDMAGQIISVLTDFDLAVSLDRRIQDEAPQKLHGTAPFMANALQCAHTSEHILEHDLESAFYILIWVTIGYKCGKPSWDVGDSLREWREGCWSEIAKTKRMFLRGSSDHHATVKLVRPEYQCLLEPIEKLRESADLQQCMRGGRYPKAMITPFTPQMFFECLGAK